MALLHAEGKVLSTDYEGNDVLIEALVNGALRGRLRDFVEAASDESVAADESAAVSE